MLGEYHEGYNNTMNLLLIDDDHELASMVQDYLARQGIVVQIASDGVQGLAQALAGGHDLILLDGMLPGMDGLELLRQLRRRSKVPVMMLTARGTPNDRIAGLDLGADDYLPKPFTPAEMLARIRAVLRRSQPVQPNKSEKLVMGKLSIDSSQREAWLESTPCELTSLQFEILDYLMRHAGRSISRDELTGILHQREATPFERWLDVHISQLRKKIERDGTTRIHTVRGVGYMFSSPGADPS
jgi:two-component system, OmpR family, response regulator CpxR